MRIESPYHAGERMVQERAGERVMADRNGGVIDTTIPGPAMGFITQQSMVVLASVDQRQRPWASLCFGVPGFVQPESPERLFVDLSRAWPQAADPCWENFAQDSRAGLLLIELATRRRLRINGRVHCDARMLTVDVERAYPNCPKYIQRRHVSNQLATPDQHTARLHRGTTLTEEQQGRIRMADTLFVASLHPEHGADASHRGGKQGFVQLLDANTLRIPDYPGNSMFNTLGNFTEHAHGGILFPDFLAERTLQLVGEVAIRWDLDDPHGLTGGTGRFWDFTITETLDVTMPIRATWEFLDASPFNP